MAMIRHQVSIRTPASSLYGALTTESGIAGWWDKPTAINSHPGVTWEFRPGPEHGVLKMRVIDDIPYRRVEWECISTHPANSPAFAWTGTHIIFEIAERNGTSTLTFRHTGWDENDEYFGFCNYNWGVALQTLKVQCEPQPENRSAGVAEGMMARDRFLYVTYIRTTAAKLWDALIKPDISRLYYFDGRFESSWKKGSLWRITTPDGRLVNSGEVLEITSPTLLALSWRNHLKPNLNAEGVSRATFDLDPHGSLIKVTLTHEIDRAESELIKDVSGGWPIILASLKTLLETGESFAETRQWPAAL